MTLFIGDKNFSSWSMRAWLAASHSGLPFKERKILLDRPNTKEELKKHSPSERVPVLVHNGWAIWDSLAISEYLAELAPQSGLLPVDASVRAQVRSYVCEMHSGFQALRSQMSMDLQLKIRLNHLSPQTIEDIQRIVALWNQALKDSGGPYLFGNFTMADAFYAPVVTRFLSYGVLIKNPLCQKYMTNIMSNKKVFEWIRAAKKETQFRRHFS